MNFILLGSGGREHAIAEKIAESPITKQLFTLPGNPGTAKCGTNVSISVTDFEKIAEFALKEDVTVIISGPEAPLAEGLSDFFSGNEKLQHIKVIGPSQAGAMLESSKDFSKQFMEKYKIPTAAYKTFTSKSIEEGDKFLESLKAPYVLKADGLAAGKGVVIPETLSEAKAELKEMLGGKFGDAGNKVVIEEFLEGIELSVFVLTDGENYITLPEAKDYKRIGDNDSGPNTGGMGAVSPVPFADEKFMSRVEEEIIKPTIKGIASEKIDYCGFIFIGLMKCGDAPYVIEYNVRMGDPETEVVFPRITSDVAEMFALTATGKLNDYKITVSDNHAVALMLVSDGYPGNYEKGKLINLEGKPNIFHAGTAMNENNLQTNGGRVIAARGVGTDTKTAIKNAYLTNEKVSFEGKFFRTDIGKDLL